MKFLKRLTKLNWITLALSLVPCTALLLLWNKLPDQVPTNWGFNGTVTYGSKINLLPLAGMGPLFSLLFPFTAEIDPKRKNIFKFRGSFDLFLLVTILFLDIVAGVLLIESFRFGTVDVQMVVLLGIGVLFTVIGNFMPRFRHNYFCGIRTPWTLASETVWNQTHRVFGRLFFVWGLITCAAAFLPELFGFWIALGGLMVFSIGSMIYSYLLYRREQAD